MKEPTYHQTISHAWEVVWHNKSLWILGLFSVLLGQFGFSDIFGKIWTISDLGGTGKLGFLLPIIKLDWSGDILSTLGIVWLVGICLAILLFLIFLAVASQGALILYASDWLKTKKHQPLAKPWNRSLTHFWSILAVNALRNIFVGFFLVIFAVTLGNFLYSQTLSQGFFLAISLAVLLFASLFIAIISIYALCALVIDGKGLRAAASKAWEIFSHHTLVSLEIGVLLMLLNLLLVVAIMAAGFVAFLPALLIWITAGFSNMLVLAAIGFSVGVFLWVVLIVLITGFFNAYTTSAWVFLYTKMHKEGISSRTINFVRGIFGK